MFITPINQTSPIYSMMRKTPPVQHGMGDKYGAPMQPSTPNQALLASSVNRPVYSGMGGAAYNNADPSIIHPALLGAMRGMPMGLGPGY